MTDRNDLDSQIFRTFVGCGAADEKTARAGTGEELKQLLKENHRYIFSLIHKFNQDVDPREPYSARDDIIVISDEAHRTQAGKLARNMRLALLNRRQQGLHALLDGGDDVSLSALGIAQTEKHLRVYGFDPARLIGAKGFARIAAIADGTEAVINARDEGRRRFEILSRQVFDRFKALIMEPAAFVFAERHDNIETIYKKLQERRDTADVTELLKELHRIVNEAIRTAEPGDDQMNGKLYDLGNIDLEKLRDEFAKKAKRKASALEDIRQVVEKKLAQMLARNPQRMDWRHHSARR